RAVFSERGRAAELALAGKEARIGMANTFEPRSGSCKLQKEPISVCSYRLSTAPQSHSQGEICSALRRLLRSRTDHKKRWSILREVAATAGFRLKRGGRDKRVCRQMNSPLKISPHATAATSCSSRDLALMPWRANSRTIRWSFFLSVLG